MSDTPEKKPDEITEAVNAAQKATGFLFVELPPLQSEYTKDEKTWGMLGHLSVLVQFVGIPSFVGPIAVYLIKKHESRFIHFHALQTLFLMLASMIAGVVLGTFFFIATVITAGLAAWPLLGIYGLLAVAFLVYIVLMGVKANEGKWVSYPYIGKMAYDKVVAAPEPKKPETSQAAPTTTPPSNPV